MFDALIDLIRKVTGQEQAKSAPVRHKPHPPVSAAAARVAATTSAVPRTSRDPGQFEHVAGAEVWRFCVPDANRACVAAAQRADRQTSAAAAIKAPLPECDRNDCQCSYRLERDRRKGPRRNGSERREAVRFETKKVDRRKNDGRRREDGWTGAKP